MTVLHSYNNSGKRLADALQPFVDRHLLAGAVLLVADNERVLASEAVGYADIAAGRPMKPDTLFWIASQTKPITAAAVMMLVEEGKIHLDDRIDRYLPEFSTQWLAVEQDADHLLLKRPEKPVTIRHILSHTSGLPYASAMEQPTLDVLALRDVVRSYAMTPLQSEPATRYAYSNAGVNTAGRILEMVSGMPYEAFLAKRLLEPLSMKDTTFWPNKRQLGRLAKTYKPDAAGTGLEETLLSHLRHPLSDRTRHPVPGGGLFSTASDTGRFCRMILNGGVFEGRRYLSEASVREMTRKQTGESLAEGYGLGWTIAGGSFGHSGAGGVNLIIDAARNLVTVFMVHHEHGPHVGAAAEGHKAFRLAAEEFAGSGALKIHGAPL